MAFVERTTTVLLEHTNNHSISIPLVNGIHPFLLWDLTDFLGLWFIEKSCTGGSTVVFRGKIILLLDPAHEEWVPFPLGSSILLGKYEGLE